MTDPPIDNHSDFMQYVWDLEGQNKQLLDVTKKGLSLIDVIMAYAENTPTPVLTNAAVIGQEIEKILADIEKKNAS